MREEIVKGYRCKVCESAEEATRYIGYQVFFMERLDRQWSSGVLESVRTERISSYTHVISISNRLSGTNFAPDQWLICVPIEQLPAHLSDQPLTNKGRTRCFKCQCATEQKRDFQTFEVREFCPRCHI